jgi:hypothetical protein
MIRTYDSSINAVRRKEVSFRGRIDMEIHFDVKSPKPRISELGCQISSRISTLELLLNGDRRTQKFRRNANTKFD